MRGGGGERKGGGGKKRRRGERRGGGGKEEGHRTKGESRRGKEGQPRRERTLNVNT